MSELDEQFMKRALELARQGKGQVSPNPAVGAVLVRDGRIIGEGFFLYEHFKHAEIYALEAAGGQSRGATLYCSLEPCCFQGRTPPCTDALIAAGIARAVVAVADPHPRVRGRGLQQLRDAGIAVEVGLLEAEARRLNEAFFKFALEGTLFIHAVQIECSDATKSSWMPSPEFLEIAKAHDAILIESMSEPAMTVLRACLEGHRHHPLVVVGDRAVLQQVGARLPIINDREKAIAIEVGAVTSASEQTMDTPTWLEQMCAPLAEIRAQNVLAFASITEPSPLINVADKLTLVVSAEDNNDQQMPELKEAIVITSAGCKEITGYPRRRDANAD
jgi:riboflavin biosynthesis protein RibD